MNPLRVVLCASQHFGISEGANEVTEDGIGIPSSFKRFCRPSGDR